MSIIKHIKIENSVYKMIDGEFIDRLNDLKRVNIFVGANNSGKSRFMRSLFFNNGIPLKFFPNDMLLNEYLDKSKEFKSYENSIFNPYSTEKQKAYDDIKLSLKNIDYLEEGVTPLPELVSVYKTSVMNATPGYERLLMAYIGLFEKFFPNLEFNDNLFKYDFYKMYLPSLRGLVPITLNEENSNREIMKDFYAERIKKDYFPKDSDILTDIADFLANDMQDIDSDTVLDLEDFVKNYIFPKNSIISGQRFYEYVRNYLLGDLEQRDIIADYELYLSETFFENKPVVLIPKVNDDVLTVKIDSEEFKIYDLGEGIQSIILITLPLFLYLEKSKEPNTNVLIFIEEPEVGLHPRLQRILMETLLDERFENYQFFFTTHSNHFIDMTLENDDISVYLFEKNFRDNEYIANFNITKCDFESNLALESLGVLPSASLLTNCKIFVEGSYDLPHYLTYLNLYQEYLKEQDSNSKVYIRDVHYKFLRGGGKNELTKTIRELSNVEKQRTFLILDFDNESEKEEYISKFQRWNYDNYHILDVIEVENLISKEILLKILNNMPKICELGVNEDFDEDEYQQADFHEFIIENIILGEVPDTFFSKGYLKKRFSKMEKKFLNSYKDLSEPAKAIAKELYEFIYKNNN